MPVPVLSPYFLRSVGHPHEGPQVVTEMTTSGAITAGQVLVVSGDGTVAAGSAASAACVGVALTSAGSGEIVRVIGRGPIFSSTASGAITAGAQVINATGGAVATVGAATAFQVIGVALTTAAGGVVVWMLT